jgi:outer membrane protein
MGPYRTFRFLKSQNQKRTAIPMINKKQCPSLKPAIFVLFLSASLFAGESILLSPEKVIQLAKTQSIAVQMSLCNLKSLDEAKQSAFSGFFPTLSANASAMHVLQKAQMELGGGGGTMDLSGLDSSSRTVMMLLYNLFSNMKIETPNNLFNIGFTIAQPLFTGGRIANAYKQTVFSLSARKWTQERMLSEVGLSALQLYWLYVNSLKQIEALKETRLWFETMIVDQQKMLEQGLIIELDVLNSKIQLDNTKLGQIKLENALTTVGENLLLFLDLPADGKIEVDTTMLSAASVPFSPPNEDTIEKIITRREDVLALLNQIEALRCVKKIQAAASTPSIAAVGNFSYTNQYSTTDGDMKKSSAAGLSLNWNLFDWGKSLHDKKATDYQILALELQEKNLRSQIRMKILELSRKVQESVLISEIALKDLEIARKAMSIAQKKYDAQAITNTELLTSRNQLTAKTVGLAQARISVLLALEEYKVAAVGQAGAGGQ